MPLSCVRRLGQGAKRPGARRAHHDVDLLLFDPDAADLDDFLAASGEIPEKRLSHKRRFTADGILVELFIARSEGGAYVT